MKTKIENLKALWIYAVMCRFLFVLTIPIWVLNIVIAGIIGLPFWVITGKVIYDTKMVQGFNDWHHSLYSNGT